MPIALSLHFDPATAAAVRGVWSALAAGGVSRDMLELGYPPHLTLIVAEDARHAPMLASALPRLAPLVPAVLALGDVRQFEGTSVTWLSCTADGAGLEGLHAAAADVLPADAVEPHYRVGAWTPHVTLALGGVAETLLRVARATWTPRREVMTTRLEVARFPPPVAIAGVTLPAR